MVGRSAKPTKAQKARMDLIARLPCHDCEYDGVRQPFPTEVDHSVRNGYRRLSGGHDGTMPRCRWHHRGDCLPGLNSEKMRYLYGPSKALHHKHHITRYGSDEEVLERVNAKLARIVTSSVYTVTLMPKRIQRKRTKGWRMPEGAVSVTRPGRFGNPFKIGSYGPLDRNPIDAAGAVGFFIQMFHDDELREAAGYPSVDEISHHLRGKDLACYCDLDELCHADVLLELANR